MKNVMILTGQAYQMAKCCNKKRVMAEAVKWGARGARVNSISPGIIVCYPSGSGRMERPQRSVL